ncbi:MAG: polyphosphate kinase 2 [Saprospiraceae bacterium]|nr:polyphosphate kinase 2 [Saprospiraceae bacterium]
MKYTKSELKMLSSKSGVKQLLSSSTPDTEEVLTFLKYRKELRIKQVELIHLQNWVVENNERVLILFEGGEFAGKGSAIRAFMDHLNPRSSRLVALPKPSEDDLVEWYFQRYVVRLPHPGELVFFDRSWYNRGLVEPVNGFCTKKQYQQFMHDVIHFENMLIDSGIILIKIYLQITKQEQADRIELVRKNPLRRWELTSVDENAQSLWNKYNRYEKNLFKLTSTKKSPWIVVDGNDKYQAHLDCMSEVLSVVPYQKTN